ncbi:hypothetical protein [Natronorubrum sulfidifaciens]|uniref:hypothetical protein n=1 Tax=Natronorubrum sulfidifaciens TaxID=388259 RepID=UPI000A01A44F|nr:hypothetical protein [Natronorubrum sulfidifaciens]
MESSHKTDTTVVSSPVSTTPAPSVDAAGAMDMNPTPDARDSESETTGGFDCPSCGSAAGMVTVFGPTEGVVSPCGCRVPPDALESP